jgi:hypothetical protein
MPGIDGGADTDLWSQEPARGTALDPELTPANATIIDKWSYGGAALRP